MALDIKLQEIAGKSAGVYQIVIDRTQRATISPTSTLRLIPINTRKGPVNNLVYINARDYAGLEQLYGQIKARDERKGNFSIRTARHALENGPILVMNMRKFDDSLDKTTCISSSSKITESNGIVKEIPYTSLLNTDRLWFPDNKKLGTNTLTKESLLSFGNVGSSLISFFVRKSNITGFDMTIKDFYANKNLEIPEYLNPYDKMSDTFLDVYVFGTNFRDNLLNKANENYGYLFTEDGLKSVYTSNGVDYDTLNLLVGIEDAKYIKKYTGSVLPGLTDFSNNVIDICQLINADSINTGLIVHFNEDVIDSLYSDWEGEYDEDDNPIYSLDKFKRPFGIDLVGHGRFHTDATGAVILQDKPASGPDFISYPQILSHVSGKVYTGKTTWVNTLIPQVGEEGDVDYEPAKNSFVITNDYNPNVNTETLKMTALAVVNTDSSGNKLTSKFYVLDISKGIFYDDYVIAKTSNLCKVKSSKVIGKVLVSPGVEYNVLEIETTEPVAAAIGTTKSDGIVLSDGTILGSETDLFQTDVVLYHNVADASYTNALNPIVLKSYSLREEQFCDGTPMSQKAVLDVMNDPSIIKGLKALNEYKFRYIIDAFKSYIEPNIKNQFAYLANALNVRAICNMPFMEDFAKSENPYFRTSPSTTLDISFIPKGGNKKLVSSNSFSLPVENSDKIWFFGPGMVNNSTGREVTVPFAGAVSKAFLNKFLAGDLFPYSTVANRNGIIICDGMVGAEWEITDDERDYLEPFGYNPIIYIENQGMTIYGDQTAQQSVKSDLSKIHVSELVFTIQEEMKKILKDYVFESNNYSNRLEIYTKAESVMQKIFNNGGVLYWENQINTDNNTQEVIDNSMGILDTTIVATLNGEKWVHRTYLERGGNISGFEIL